MSAAETSLTAQSIPVLVRLPETGDREVTAAEVYLLTRIDGVSDVAALAALCGQELGLTLARLRGLQRRGFIYFKAGKEGKENGGSPHSILEILDQEDRQPVGQFLPRLLRQKVRVLAEQGDSLTYYQLLNIPRSSTLEAIKKAYLGLSKELHPDRYFGRELGEYKGLLDRVFARVNKAHEVLSDGEKRQAYDQTLSLADRGAAQGAEEGGREAAAPQTLVAVPTGRPSAKSIEQTLNEEDADPELAAVDREARRRILAIYMNLDRHNHYELLEVGRKTPLEGIERAVQYMLSRLAPENFPRDLGPYERRRQKIVQLVQAARQVLTDPAKREAYDKQLELAGAAAAADPAAVLPHGGFLENLYRAKVYFERGQQELKSGNKAAALSNFQLAATLNPKDKNYRQAFEELKWVAQEVRQENVLKRALQKEKERDYKGALDLYEQLYQDGQKTAAVYRGLACCYLAANRELGLARDYAEKALKFQPESAELHCLLGRVLTAVGDEKGAKKEFKRALEIDKTYEEAAAALAAAKK